MTATITTHIQPATHAACHYVQSLCQPTAHVKRYPVGPSTALVIDAWIRQESLGKGTSRKIQSTMQTNIGLARWKEMALEKHGQGPVVKVNGKI